MFGCRAGEETGELDLEEQREREDLQSACLLLWQECVFSTHLLFLISYSIPLENTTSILFDLPSFKCTEFQCTEFVNKLSIG